MTTNFILGSAMRHCQLTPKFISIYKLKQLSETSFYDHNINQESKSIPHLLGFNFVCQFI